MRNDLLSRSHGCSTASGVMFLLVCMGVGIGASARAGVVNLTSQTRYVLVTTEGAPVSLPAESQRQDAPDFGSFNGSVSSENFPQQLQGILQRISQSSSMTVTPDGAVIVDQSALHGSISFNALPARSFFDVQFTLTAAAPFDLTYVGLAGDGRFIQQSGTIINGSFTGPGAPGLLAPADLHTYTRGDLLHYSGTLQPGTFDVRADLNADENTGNVDLTLNIGPATVGSAVPLPAAAWATFAALPLLGIALRRLSRNLRSGPR